MTDSIHEMNVVGRELSSKTFSGKPLDYNIPDIFQVHTNQDLILSCIESYFSQFDDFALLLSGGKDSRLLACILKKMQIRPTCYTYIGRHSKYEENELKVAKKVAEKLNFPHKTIELNWEKFYDVKKIRSIMKQTDGVPLFHGLLTMAHIRSQIPEKNLITGDLVTELWDTMEYRPLINRQPLKETLYKRENLIIKDSRDIDVVNKLKKMYEENDEKRILFLIKSDRLIRKQVYKKLGWNVLHPAIDPDTIRHILSLDLKNRTDGAVCRKLVKKINPDLYKFRTARSPFSLRYPLSFHIAYGKVMKTGVNNTPIKGGFDKEVIETKNKQKRYRLDNYKWWKEIHG